jgi:hypothetical protein
VLQISISGVLGFGRHTFWEYGVHAETVWLKPVVARLCTPNCGRRQVG